MKELLKEWKSGDLLLADDLQAVVDTTRRMEQKLFSAGTFPGGVCKRIADGPIGWPWQVYGTPEDTYLKLYVIPGRVVTGVLADPATGEYIYQYTSAGDSRLEVEDLEKDKKETIVYLELSGWLDVAYAPMGEIWPEETFPPPYPPNAPELFVGWQRTEISYPLLRVTCKPADSALRVWPLAAVNLGDKQPITQLQWGDLNALECRGIASADGLLKPTALPVDNGWGTAGHKVGMSKICSLIFDTRAENIRGELHGRLGTGGEVEFYLGGYVPRLEEEEPEPWPEDDEEEDEYLPPGPYTPVKPPPVGDIRVRYGYVAGNGFLSCGLIQDANGRYFWELELDPEHLAKVCRDLTATATATVQADGSSAGTITTVAMGIESCRVTASGMLLQGTVTFVFAGTDGDDAGTKQTTFSCSYKGSPVWQQPRKWYLSPNRVHLPGNYVARDVSSRFYSQHGFVAARKWYKFRVKDKEFRKAAAAEFARALAKIKVADSQSSVSYDSTVSGTLSGSALKPVFTFTLQ